MVAQSSVTPEDTFRQIVFPFAVRSFPYILGHFSKEWSQLWYNSQGDAMCDKYLLIIPCSKRKASLTKAKIPAIDLYDGPFHRIIRKSFRERGKPNNLDIMVLSAKYGLIDLNEKIATYNQRMTPEMARGMAGNVYSSLANRLKTNHYKEVMINLGKQYMMALSESWDMLENQKVRYGSGGIGERMKQLKNWLSDVYPDGR